MDKIEKLILQDKTNEEIMKILADDEELQSKYYNLQQAISRFKQKLWELREKDDIKYYPVYNKIFKLLDTEINIQGE